MSNGDTALARVFLTVFLLLSPCPTEIYHSVDGYNKDVQALAKQYPALIKLEEVGKSRNGDPIYLIRMTGGK